MYYVMYNKFYKKINLIYLFVLIISGTCFSQNSDSKINQNPNFKKLLDLSKEANNEYFNSNYFSIQVYSGPFKDCLLYTSPSPRDKRQSRMPSSA